MSADNGGAEPPELATYSERVERVPWATLTRIPPGPVETSVEVRRVKVDGEPMVLIAWGTSEGLRFSYLTDKGALALANALKQKVRTPTELTVVRGRLI